MDLSRNNPLSSLIVGHRGLPLEYPDNAGSEWMKTFDNSLDNIGHPGSFVGIGIGWACASAGPLDYFKMTVGEGGIRTPLLIAGPGINGPRQEDSFAYITDITPTILYLSGLPVARDMVGKPLVGIVDSRFRGRRRVSYVGSYGKMGAKGARPKESILDKELMKRFKELGYID